MQIIRKRIALIVRIIAVLLAFSSVLSVWMNYNTAFRSVTQLILHFVMVFIVSIVLCFMTYYLQQKEPAEEFYPAYIRYHVIAAAGIFLFMLFAAATEQGRSIGFLLICLSTVLLYSAPILFFWGKNK